MDAAFSEQLPAHDSLESHGAAHNGVGTGDAVKEPLHRRFGGPLTNIIRAREGIRQEVSLNRKDSLLCEVRY